MLKLFDNVFIDVITTFGTVKVEFTIVDILPNYHYALLAQHRICVGQKKVNNTWTLSEPVDLLNIRPIEGVCHKTLIVATPQSNKLDCLKELEHIYNTDPREGDPPHYDLLKKPQCE